VWEIGVGIVPTLDMERVFYLACLCQRKGNLMLGLIVHLVWLVAIALLFFSSYLLSEILDLSILFYNKIFVKAYLKEVAREWENFKYGTSLYITSKILGLLFGLTIFRLDVKN
jgi:hypothetical protein